MHKQLNIVILAAGKGTRMFSNLPKVLHELAGRPLLQHVVDTARQLKPKKICVVYGHGGDLVPDTLPAADLAFVKQEPQLGTGHALMQALPHLDNNGLTLVLYGDVPLIRSATLMPMISDSAEHITVLTVTLDDPMDYGRIVRDTKGNITAIVEEKEASSKQRAIKEVNTGILSAPTALLSDLLSKLKNNNAKKEFFLTDVISLAKEQGVEVISASPKAAWETLGVNSKAQLVELERIYQNEYSKRLLSEGVSLADPKRIDVRGELKCGADVSIDVNCIFEGAVQLGDGVKVGANCIIRDTSIAAGTKILPFCHIEDAIVGNNCRIGPYARIRPGSDLGDEVHIGNFVEIKKSKIGAKSKANHLSYIGDSEIGRNVNVGAGMITCNYDGANKHKTIIEDDVFIGSDTQLIAPILVGRGATIGAGTTLTKDAPAGELTLSRAKQVSIRDWKRPGKKSSDKK